MLSKKRQGTLTGRERENKGKKKKKTACTPAEGIAFSCTPDPTPYNISMILYDFRGRLGLLRLLAGLGPGTK